MTTPQSQPASNIPVLDPSNPPAPAQSTASVIDDITNAAAELFGEKKAAPATPTKAPELAPAKTEAPKEAPAAPPAEAPKSALPDMKAVADDVDLPPNMSPKAAENWKKLKAEREAARKEAAALKAQVEAAKQSAQANPEFEQLKKEREELSQQLQMLDVERHPKFQAYFGQRMEQAIATAKSLVPADKADHVAALLQAPESAYRSSQLNEVLAEMSPLESSQFGAALLSLKQVQSERQAELAKVKDNYSRIQQQRIAEQQAQQQQFEKSFNEIVEAHKEVPVFATRDGDEAWNQSVNQRLELARNIYGGKLPVQDLARASLWAAAAPEFMRQAIDLSKENAALKAENEALRGSSPTLGGSGSTPGAETDIPADADYLQAVMAETNKRLGSRW